MADTRVPPCRALLTPVRSVGWTGFLACGRRVVTRREETRRAPPDVLIIGYKMPDPLPRRAGDRPRRKGAEPAYVVSGAACVVSVLAAVLFLAGTGGRIVEADDRTGENLR
ncbi:hypothetical protein ACIA6T_18990 [Streptomyces sp. NPDC051740]|uniref:hypothetical protein n=1 Tax=Streptomyces sp. NPDC051740 TaxID=3365673 RepID=UPI0037B3D7B4